MSTSVTLPEVQAHLNITNNTSDIELQTFLNAAEAAIEKRTGPIVVRSVTSYVYGGPMALPIHPVVSLTSITPDGGSALSLTGFYVSPYGIVTSPSSLTASNYTVVYVAGHAATAAAVPADLKLAVLEMTRHLWDSQRRSRGAAEVPGSAHAWPYRVEELIAPYVMMAGFA